MRAKHTVVAALEARRPRKCVSVLSSHEATGSAWLGGTGVEAEARRCTIMRVDGMFKAVAAALHKHASVADVQSHVCFLLANLTCGSGAS